MKISGHKTESVYKRYAIENRKQRRAALATIEQFRAGQASDQGQNGDKTPSAVGSAS